MSFKSLTVVREGPVETVTLNRPDLHNALNDELIHELYVWAEFANVDNQLRVAILQGAGPSFSAGADVAWMARAARFTHDENLQNATALARTFSQLDTLSVPLIGRVHGAALGGGAGLAACCDVVVAEESAIFGFTEVKLGILPAVISPFVLAKIGVSAARELFLTGARFSAARAHQIGLVHAVAPAAELDSVVSRQVNEILAAGPQAIAEAKSLIRSVMTATREELIPITARAIADRRVSDEGQEGLRAFLEKRKPRWHRER